MVNCWNNSIHNISGCAQALKLYAVISDPNTPDITSRTYEYTGILNEKPYYTSYYRIWRIGDLISDPIMCLFYNHHWKVDSCTLTDSQDGAVDIGHVLSYADEQCPEDIGQQWAKYADPNTVDKEVFLWPEYL